MCTSVDAPKLTRKPKENLKPQASGKVSFPKFNKTYPELCANDLVKIQPMTLATPMFMEFSYVTTPPYVPVEAPYVPKEWSTEYPWANAIATTMAEQLGVQLRSIQPAPYQYALEVCFVLVDEQGQDLISETRLLSLVTRKWL